MKEFYSTGDSYEGEYKAGHLNGQGKYCDKLSVLYYYKSKNEILAIVLTEIGKYFYSNGDRFEGEFKIDEKISGIRWFLLKLISCFSSSNLLGTHFYANG